MMRRDHAVAQPRRPSRISAGMFAAAIASAAAKPTIARHVLSARAAVLLLRAAVDEGSASITPVRM
ncbi:MAG: hypothetical protein ACLUHE_02340 [Christensenellales bacterium]